MIGYDHKFGKDRQGDFELLKNMASTYHYEVVEIPAHILSDITISSTKIRNKLMEGKNPRVPKYLIITIKKYFGTPFCFLLFHFTKVFFVEWNSTNKTDFSFSFFLTN